MQHSFDTDSYLAIARADAADRQRRAERYRQRHDAAPTPRVDRRRATITVILTAAVSAGIVALGPTATADDTVDRAPGKPSVGVEQPVAEDPLPTGRVPGRPDGWYDPDDGPDRDRVPPNLR